MIDDITLIFATDNRTGTPALRVKDSKLPFDETEREELEHEVRSRYERLVRSNGSRHTLAGWDFDVEVQSGMNPRQPTLVLRPAPGGARPLPLLKSLARHPAQPAATAARTNWRDGFFAELQQLVNGTTVKLPVHERTPLEIALDELRSFPATAGVRLVVLLFGAYLATVEQHYQECDPARAGLYGLARRAISRSLPQPEPSPPQKPPVECKLTTWRKRLMSMFG